MMNEILTCRRASEGSVTKLYLSGDLTAGGVIRLAEEFQLIRQAHPIRVIVNLKNLRVLDSAGFAFLKASTRYFASLGIELIVRGLAPAVARMIDLKGIDRSMLDLWMGDSAEGIEGREAPKAAETHASTPEGISGSILVVDDEDMVRKYIVTYLSHKGYPALEAKNATEAIELLTANRNEIHLALVDYLLGNESGVVLAEQLVKIKPELKVVLISGMEPESQEAEGAANIVKRMQKPFTGEQLLWAIREALEGQ